MRSTSARFAVFAGVAALAATFSRRPEACASSPRPARVRLSLNVATRLGATEKVRLASTVTRPLTVRESVRRPWQAPSPAPQASFTWVRPLRDTEAVLLRIATRAAASAPVVVMRPIVEPTYSLNQTAPSGPGVSEPRSAWCLLFGPTSAQRGAARSGAPTYYTPDDQARNHPAHELETAVNEGRYEEEGWRLRNDGSTFWASVMITAGPRRGGPAHRLRQGHAHLTERKYAEDELQRTLEELRRANEELDRSPPSRLTT